MDRKRIVAGAGAALAVVLYLVLGEGPNAPGVAGDVVAESALLEIPVVSNPGRIVRHDAYVASYNPETLIPDWVAYELTAEETEGRLERDGISFRMDPDLRGKSAMREDYSGSGWTKGHMMPAADASFDRDAMEQTFYFTNICPQSGALNAGDWQYLEKKTRQMAQKYGRVWVVTGPIVGENRYGSIGDRDVVVPDAFFKALLVEKNGGYSSIAFVMGNDDRRYFLSDCALSVDEVEVRTGLDLFPALEDTVEEKVESSVCLADWGIK